MAWAFTTSGMDVQDLFLLGTLNSTHYLAAGEALPFTITRTPVKVKVGGTRTHTAQHPLCPPVRVLVSMCVYEYV